MTYQNIRVAVDESIATLTIDRPAVRNALNLETVNECQSALQALAADERAGVLIITGAGETAFVSGADINDIRARKGPDGLAAINSSFFAAVERFPRPTIAAINGYALGGGCELAMACTIRIAADVARLGQPEIGLGLMPGYGGTQRLARLVGGGRALELMLTGTPIAAAEAHRIGLVNRVVPASELMAAAKGLAAQLAVQAPVATRYILEAVHRGLEMPLADAQALEAALFGLTTATEDMREGTRAFLEKRKAQFRGR
jgi:enoyl-CoA hydratase